MNSFNKKFLMRVVACLMAVCASMAVLVSVFPQEASASQIDSTRLCSITVSTPAEYKELEGKDFQVHAWLVATVDDDLNYTLTDAFANGGITVQGYALTDLNAYKMKKDETNLNKVTELAEALYGAVMGIRAEEIHEKSSTGYAPDPYGQEGKPILPVDRDPDEYAIAPDYTFTVSGGSGTQSDVPAGYYLILPEAVTDGEYEYIYAPTLISAPFLDMVEPEEGEGQTAEQGATGGNSGSHQEWVYSVHAMLKPERDYRRGGIVIRKHLTAYNETLQNADFVFTVSAVKNGKVVYSNAIKLSFDGSVNDKAYYVLDLPVGSIVTVKEEYSGSCYEIADPSTLTQTADVVISDSGSVEDSLVEFVFVNQPNDHIPKEVSVLNHYDLLNDGTYGHHNEYEDSTQENSQK